MQGVDTELIQALGYIRSCGYLLVVMFVGVAAIVAGAKLGKSIGVWVFAGSMILYGLMTLLSTGLDAAQLDFEIMQWFYVLSSLITIALNLGMLVGMALVKPVLAQDQNAQEVRG